MRVKGLSRYSYRNYDDTEEESCNLCFPLKGSKNIKKCLKTHKRAKIAHKGAKSFKKGLNP